MENGQFSLIFFVRVLSLLMIACQSSPNLLDWSDWSFQMSDFRSGSHQKKHVIFTHFKTTGMTAKIWRCRNTVFIWQCYYNNIPVHIVPQCKVRRMYACHMAILTPDLCRCTIVISPNTIGSLQLSPLSLIPPTFSLCKWKSYRTEMLTHGYS